MSANKRNSKKQETQFEYLDRIKKLAVIAMFSDDELMNRLVLKGGNAINLIYKLSSRASIDVDFSLETEFEEYELESIERKIVKCLEETYWEAGLKVFDVKFTKKPSIISEEVRKFWGGYQVEFKVIPKEMFEQNSEDVDFLRRNAAVVGPRQVKKFKVDISKFEYCKDKKQKDLEGYTVYVYSPAMLVIEKIRAICQQMPEYKEIIKTMIASPRSRDFFDIYILMKRFSVDLNESDNWDMLQKMFEVKRVPLALLNNIEKFRDFHREGFDSLKDTVNPDIELKDFDFYFDYVVSEVGKLKSYKSNS